MSLRDLVFNIFARDKTGRAFDAVSRKMDGLDRRAKAAKATLAGAGLGAGLTAPLAGFGTSILRAAGDFEAAMNRVSAVAGTSETELAALTAEAKRLGETTQFSASQAAEGIEILAKNGLSAADILGGALSSSLTLAAASGAELGDASDIATDVMQQFGKRAGELAPLVDGITGVLTASKFGIDDYRLALAQAGGVAGGVGVEFEDFNAAIAATSSLFASGSDAGTSFKTFLQSLNPKSKAAGRAMQELGLEFFDAGGNMKSMAEIAQELQDGLSGLSEESRNAALSTIFGSDAMRTAIGLAEQGAEGIGTLHEAIGKSSATEQAEARLAGFNGQMKKLASAFEGLKLAIADSGFLGFVTDMALGLTSLLSWLAQADPVLLKFATALGVAATIAGPLIVTLGVFSLAVGAISAPVALVIAGIAAFGAALYALWEPIKLVAGFIADQFIAAWEGLKTAFDLAINSPLEFAEKLGELLLSFNPLVLAVKGLGEIFEWLFPNAMESIKKLVSGAKEWLLDRLTGIFDSVKQKIADVGDAFYDLWDRVVGHSYIPDLVDDIGTEMARLDSKFVDPAIKANEKVAGSFRDLAEGAADDLADLAKNGDLTMRSFYDTILAAGERWRDQMLDEVFDKLAKAASDKLSGIGGKGGSGGGGGGFLNSLINFGASLFGGSGGGSGDALTDALNAAGASAQAPAFNTGGEAALIGGRGGVDRNLVRLRLSEGERVQVTRRGQNPASANVTVNITTPNPAAFQASRVQLAGQISRAVAYGQRGM